MSGQVEVVIDASDALHGLDRAHRQARRGLAEALRELGHYAHGNMLMYVHGRLARKISQSGVWEDPGTGDMQLSVGAEGPAEWPLYVHDGTGVFGWRHERIFARDDREAATVVPTRRARRRSGGVMRFVGRDGRVYFRRSVEGQAPNPYVRRAYASTAVFANARVQRLGREIIGI